MTKKTDSSNGDVIRDLVADSRTAYASVVALR